jgi:uncharacterized protein (DUF302 family)
MDFEYRVESKKSFPEAVAAVEAKTAEKGFRVLHVHDVQATLAEKGFQREPLVIIEVCNAKFAHQVLTKDMKVSLFLPCKINVFTQGGKTHLSTLRPAAMPQFFPSSGIEGIAQEVDRIITSIVDEAK